MMSTPSTGNSVRTPISTSPFTKPESRHSLCTGAWNTTIPIPLTSTKSPVSVFDEKGKTDLHTNESNEPVSRSIFTGTCSTLPGKETKPSEMNSPKSSILFCCLASTCSSTTTAGLSELAKAAGLTCVPENLFFDLRTGHSLFQCPLPLQ
ncbi:unnamed protein product [Gadus morhua 'NCC']